MTIAREEAARSSAEHVEFLRQLTARARFDVTVQAHGADADGLLISTEPEEAVVIAIGISNRRGDKAAGPTVINALVPQGTMGLRWCGPNGEQRPNAPNQLLTTPEPLPGTEFRSWYLARELERVTRRTVRLVHFAFLMEVPADGEASVPIRVRIESDDLPDEEPEVVQELIVRARRSSGGRPGPLFRGRVGPARRLKTACARTRCWLGGRLAPCHALPRHRRAARW